MAIDRDGPEALAERFERHRARLERLLRRRAGPAVLRRQGIEDLVQETFLEAVRRCDGYRDRGPGSFFRWLASLALHRTNNLRRMAVAAKRDARREVRFGGEDTVVRGGAVADAPCPGPGPRTRAAGDEEHARLWAAIAALPEADRQIVVLARVEGRPLAEVAERTGRTRNAVALRLGRVLRNLKRSLEGA